MRFLPNSRIARSIAVYARKSHTFPAPSEAHTLPEARPSLAEMRRSSAEMLPLGADQIPKTHKKTGLFRPVFYLFGDYSLEPVSISEPMIIRWKIANRMMTGRTHITAAARIGPWLTSKFVFVSMSHIA